MNPKAIKVEPKPDYQILVGFDNNETRIFDVKPLIKGEWFGKLGDPVYFKTVHIAGLSVEWEDGQDICPDDLYELSVPL